MASSKSRRDSRKKELEKEKERLTLESVPFFERPLSSGPKDKFIGKDEAGNSVFETVTGQVYTVKLSEDQRTGRQRFEEDVVPAVKEYIRDPKLPSAEEMKQFGVDAVTGAYKSLEGAVEGTGTYGDVFSLAGAGAVDKIARPNLPEKKQNTPPVKNDEDLLDWAFVEDAAQLYDRFDSVEDAVKKFKSDFKESVDRFGPESTTGKTARAKLKALDTLGEKYFIEKAYNLPHFEADDYKKYEENFLKTVADAGLDKYASLQLLNDLDSVGQDIYGVKISPILDELTETNLPRQQKIGKRALGGKRRPSDPKAEALGFKDTVYHSTASPEEFTFFNINKGMEPGAHKSAQDYLGVHVGTARAAAERNLVPSERKKNPKGFTMELRARTTQPLKPKNLKKDFGFDVPKDKGLFDSGGNFTEKGLNYLIKKYHDNFFDTKNKTLPVNSSAIAAKEFSKELAEKGYTHIPYVNDIEDPGSTSLIMLVDRPKDSPAVLRDVRAKFDPDKVTDPDLRFAEGGLAVDNQMKRLYNEGGFADDGATVEPVTGNRVPPGSLDQEVRDNVDAKLSEGEYVIPADVVRYIGLGQIERMISKAKAGLQEMEANGRIGGEPVTEEGIPMGDDELTPEEMQMLAEAMGSDPAAGMYMGGMVQNNVPQYNPYAQQQMQYTNPNQPTVGMQEGGMVKNTAPQFNPANYQFGSGSIPGVSQDQGGMELVEYINPKTGQTRMITFLNGQPIGMVPEGFVRSTEETRKQASQQDQETTTEEEPWMKDSDSQQRREEQGDQGTAGGLSSWAESNYDTIINDPLGYVKDQLSGGGFGNKLLDNAGKIGAAINPALGIVGGLADAVSDLSSVANSKAALDLAEARGLLSPEEIAEGRTLIENYTKGFNKFESAIPEGMYDGSDKFDALNKIGSTRDDETPVTPTRSIDRSSSRSSGSRSSGASRDDSDRDSDGRTQNSGVTGSKTAADFDADVQQKTKAKSMTAARQSGVSAKTAAGLSGKQMENTGGFDEEEESWGVGPMAKGGLVAKPSGYKSKVTKKKEKRKRSGLGSK